MDHRQTISRSWPAVPDSVAGVRDFVTSELSPFLSAQGVEGARVVASELATNAVQHAGTPFSVTVDWAGDQVLLRVTDAADDIPVPGEPGPLELRGRGLLLVDALSAAWGVNPEAAGGKSVWAQFPTVPGPA
jgi:anti-sigma regulatory factor (Ser/Thr protein kinase)